MSEETKTTNSTPEETGGNGERMFTQSEVNRIVSDRLAREREKAEPKEDERETALRAREKAVEAREARYKCEDYLAEMKVDEKFCLLLILPILISSKLPLIFLGNISSQR